MSEDQDQQGRQHDDRPAIKPTPITGLDLSSIDFDKLAPMMVTMDQNMATAGAANLMPKEFSNRTYGQQLTYHAAMFYLTGGGFGAINGLLHGRKKILKMKTSPQMRVKLSTLLSGMSGHAGNAANACGIIALFYVSYTHLLAMNSPRITFGHEISAALATGASCGLISQGFVGGLRGAAVGGIVYGACSLVNQFRK